MYNLVNFIFDKHSRISNLAQQLIERSTNSCDFKRVIKIGEWYQKRLAKENVDPDIYTASILSNLSRAYFLKGDFAKRRELEHMIIRLPGELSSELLQLERQDNLAFIELMSGDFRSSQAEFKRIRRRLEKMKEIAVDCKSGPECNQHEFNQSDMRYIRSAIVSNQASFGYIFEYLCRYKTAERHYKRAVELAEQLFGERSIDTMVYKQLLAGIYLKLDKVEEAHELLKMIVAVRRNFLPKRSIGIANSSLVLAQVYVKLNRSEEAEQALLKSDKVFKYLSRSGDYIDMPLLHQAKAELAFSKSDYAACDKHLDDAIKSFEKFYSTHHPVLLETLALKSRCLKELGKRKEMGEVDRRYKEIRLFNGIKTCPIQLGHYKKAA